MITSSSRRMGNSTRRNRAPKKVLGSNCHKLGRRTISGILIALHLAMLQVPLTYAAPTGGQVSAGAGTISQSGAATTINQTSQNLAINWQSFNIDSNEVVQFNQPNSSSIALNRVLGQNPSSILGSLNANGQVFVLNPNGVLFGPGSQVNVGGLVASTLNLADADFMSGKYSFSNAGTAGSVINQGTLNAAEGGYIGMLAPEVINEGVITATLGKALLGAGDKITLNLDNGSLLSYSTDQGSLNALASNSQLIQANGGQIYMSAKAANALSTAVVNNTGIVEAQTVQNVGGVIKLMGDAQVGVVNVAGTLNASGTSVGATGGTINVLGNKVQLTGATLNASGDIAGGTVLVGGDLHGQGTVPNSAITSVDSNSTINANAIGSGNGGKVIIWSDDTTTFDGYVTATAANSGNGGFAEISGKKSLIIPKLAGHVDLAATSGASGMLLLDPNTIDIVTGTTTCTTPGCTATGAALTIDPLDIETLLTAGTSVTLQTTDSDGLNGGGTDDITVTNGVNTGVATLGAKLILDANDEINGYANFTDATNVSVLLKAELIGSVTKTYDGNANVTNLTNANYNIHGLIAGDSATIGVTTGNYVGGTDVSANLANSAVTSSALALTDYTFAINSIGVGAYVAATSASGNIGSITPANLTLSGSRVYDGTTMIAGSVLTATGVNGESFSVTGTGATGNLLSANVQTGSTLASVTGLALGVGNIPAALASNYNALSTTGSSVSITPANLTLSGSRVYDGTTTIAGSVLTAAGVNGESFAVTGTGAVGNLLSANVQTGSTLASVTGLALGVGNIPAALASNYNALSVTGSSVSITPATLTYTANAGTRLYGGANPALSGTVTGFVNTDTQASATTGVLTFGTTATATSNVGNYDITGSGLTATNYIFAQAPGNATALSITPYVVSMTGTRAYDGSSTVNANIFTLSSLPNGENLTLTGAGTIASANASATPYPVTLGTLALGNGTGLNAGLASNYTFVGGTQTATITAAALSAVTASITGTPTKTYDGNANATLTSADYTLSGFVPGEGATITKTAGTYATANAGTGIGVTVTLVPTDFTATGTTVLSNYTLPTVATGTGNITPAPLTAAIVGGPTKVYNGNNAAVLTAANYSLTGFITGEGATVGQLAGTYNTADVATATTVTATLASTDFTANLGTLLSNYTLPTAANGAGSITPAPLTAAIVGAPSKVYDGTATATLASTNYSLTGFIGTEGATVTQTVGTYDSAHVMTATSVSSTLAATDFVANLGTTLSNYVLPTTASGLASITAAPLAIAANNVTLPYGDPLGAGSYTVTGLMPADTITGVSMTLPGVGTTPNVGTYVGATPSNVVFGVGSVATDYAITYTGGTLTVIPKVITLYGSRTYDQTANVNASVFGNGTIVATCVANDCVNGKQYLTLTGTGSMLDKNVASAPKSFNLGTLALGNGPNGELASNYTLVAGNITINPYVLSLTGLTAQNKIYDATDTAVISGVPVIGNPLLGDSVGVIATGTGTFYSINVGSGIYVNGGYALTGVDAINYTVPQNQMSATIFAKQITFSGVPIATRRQYDGTTVTTVTGATANGIIAGDNAVLSAIYTTPDVGVNKLASLALTGSSAGNYTLPSLTLTGTIDPRILTYTGTPVAANKVYDGTNVATITGISNITGLISSDGTSLVGLFSDKNVGNGKQVTLTLTGAGSKNYAFAPVNGLTANITPRALTLTGTPVAANRPYDGTTTAQISGATLNGVLSYDNVLLSGNFADANVGVAKPVTLSLAGADRNNYSVSLPSGLTANIVSRNLVIVADNASMMFGGTIPPLTYTVAGAGLASIDSIGSVFSGLLAVNTAGVNPGFTTPITQGSLALTVGPGGNYIISSFVNGVMTVQ